MVLLQDKVAIVTGAGAGIGRAHALELAKHGASVVVNDLGTSVTGDGADQKAADQTVELITSRGGAAVANYDDVSDYDGAGRLVAQAVGTAAATRITGTMPGAPAVIDATDVADDEFNRMDPAVSSPLVAWLASDESQLITGQVIRAVAEDIVWMHGWSEGTTISNGGKR